MSHREFSGSALRAMRRLGVAVACVLAAGAASAAGHAGQAPYEQYCAACHGVAAELKIEPADLRKLGERYGDPLAKPRLREVIDGRDMPRSHGLPDMPVWGDKLLEGVPPGADGNEFFKRGTIFVIVDYLQTLQQK